VLKTESNEYSIREGETVATSHIAITESNEYSIREGETVATSHIAIPSKSTYLFGGWHNAEKSEPNRWNAISVWTITRTGTLLPFLMNT